jgi:hypothetical protein
MLWGAVPGRGVESFIFIGELVIGELVMSMVLVFRQMRRKERSRVAQLAYRRKRDELDDEFKQNRDENERKAAEKTEKKRLKRMKEKEKKKGKKKKTEAAVEKDSTASESDSDDEKEGEGKASEVPAVVVDPLMQELPKKDPLIIYYN